MNQSIIKGIVKLHMLIAMKIKGDKTNYLSAPEEVLPRIRVHYVYIFAHLFPSVILSIILVIKIVPLISDYYRQELEKNGSLIPLTIIPLLMVMLIGFGILVERYFTNKYERYAAYKNSL